MKRTDLINLKKTHQLIGLLSSTAILFISPQSLFANDFQGSLDSVSISDAAGINQPPVAKFTYTKKGDTYTFDASASTDSDGTIATYRWELGDGATGNNSTFTYQAPPGSTDPISVTLTIIDDNQAVSIAQQTISLQTNLIPNADNIGLWNTFHISLAKSQNTWTATAKDGRLDTPRFPIAIKSSYTFKMEYKTTDPLVLNFNAMSNPPTLPPQTTWTSYKYTVTPYINKTNAYIRIKFANGATGTASIRNVQLVEN